MVLRRRGSQERQSGQRDVVLTAGQAALVVAVGAQTAERGEEEVLLSQRGGVYHSRV